MKGSREDSMGLGMAFTKSMIAYQNGGSESKRVKKMRHDVYRKNI